MPNSKPSKKYKSDKSKDAATYNWRTQGINSQAAPNQQPNPSTSSPYPKDEGNEPDMNTESYSAINERGFVNPINEALSTFSIDVDNASYTNSRRYLNGGQLPPKDAVRIEEFINYFDYSYEKPKGDTPFSINTEVAQCPWDIRHKLVHIGLQGKTYDWDEIEPMNLVFLLDVSGSMGSENKLGLVKKSLKAFTANKRPQDRVAIVVYAGASGLVLPSTTDPVKINQAMDKLKSGGSTAGGAGLALAYKVAIANKSDNSVNRVILCTDGDFNVGQSSDAAMKRLIESSRDQGVSITCLGFGMGNYKDSKMEIIADNGNGNYYYIDNYQEAEKVLVTEVGSTLYTIAKDVKLQLEFNPTLVKGYRLIGYETVC